MIDEAQNELTVSFISDVEAQGTIEIVDAGPRPGQTIATTWGGDRF